MAPPPTRAARVWLAAHVHTAAGGPALCWQQAAPLHAIGHGGGLYPAIWEPPQAAPPQQQQLQEQDPRSRSSQGAGAGAGAASGVAAKAVTAGSAVTATASATGPGRALLHLPQIYLPAPHRAACPPGSALPPAGLPATAPWSRSACRPGGVCTPGRRGMAALTPSAI